MKIVSGNPGKRPLNDREPQFDREIPLCPDFIDDEGKREWIRIVGDLHKAGLSANAYAGSLSVYCQAYADFRAAVEKIRENGGRTMIQGNGNLVAHPAVAEKNKAMLIMLKAASEFGMTPSAKSRISVPEQGKRDDLEDFLNQKSA